MNAFACVGGAHSSCLVAEQLKARAPTAERRNDKETSRVEAEGAGGGIGWEKVR